MRPFIAALVISASPALAEGWQVLDGDGVSEALSERKLQYDGAWQTFPTSGNTLYNAGRDSWGRWRVQGDQYCSQWPPQDAWACYDVDLSADGQSVRFRGGGSDVTIGVYAD